MNLSSTRILDLDSTLAWGTDCFKKYEVLVLNDLFFRLGEKVRGWYQAKWERIEHPTVISTFQVLTSHILNTPISIAALSYSKHRNNFPKARKYIANTYYTKKSLNHWKVKCTSGEKRGEKKKKVSLVAYLFITSFSALTTWTIPLHNCSTKISADGVTGKFGALIANSCIRVFVRSVNSDIFYDCPLEGCYTTKIT